MSDKTHEGGMATYPHPPSQPVGSWISLEIDKLSARLSRLEEGAQAAGKEAFWALEVFKMQRKAGYAAEQRLAETQASLDLAKTEIRRLTEIVDALVGTP